jgi:hypothetical protein
MNDSLDDVQVVTFAGAPPTLEPGEFVTHSFKDKVFGRKLEDVKDDWARLSQQVGEMAGSTAPITAAGFQLDSIEVALGFTASGKLAFIAEAGVEATVTLTLSRPGA